MKKLLILLLLVQCNLSNAQTEPKELNLNRFFLDLAPTVGMYKSGGFFDTDSSPDRGLGLELKTGNNFYLRKGKFCGIVHLTYMRLGFLFSDGLFLFASPLNVGVGHHFQLNKKVSIHTSLHSGALFVLDDVIQGDGFIDYFIMPEIKLNINHFTIGLEYAPKRDYNSAKGSIGGYYHYFGISFGGTFLRL